MSLEQALQANTQAIYALIEHMKTNSTPVKAPVVVEPEPTPTPAPTPAPTETPVPTPAAEPEHVQEEVAKVDRAQVQHALLAVAKTHGKPAAVAVLEAFGVKGLTDLSEDKYADCLAKLNAVLAQDKAA